MPTRIFYKNRVGKWHMSPPHRTPKHSRVGLRAPITASILHILDGNHAFKQLGDTQFVEHGVGIN